MAGKTIDEALAEYKPEDYSVRLLQGVLAVLPGAPAYVHYRNVEDAVRALAPNATAAQLAEARALANDRDLQDVVWMAGLMDTGDSAYGVYTGLRSALGFFFGDRAKALETDDQQRNDAALKAVALGYLVWNAYPGSVAEKSKAFAASTTGQQLAWYYAAVEVALPFADNALTSTGDMLSELVNGAGDAQTGRLSKLAGGLDLSRAREMLAGIVEPLRGLTAKASQYVEPVARSARTYLPGVMATTDKVAGAVATGADLLPVYRLLGARLAAESAARRALGR